MSKTIRIGTRDSELALYQAKVVQKLLEEKGHKTILVPVNTLRAWYYRNFYQNIRYCNA